MSCFAKFEKNDITFSSIHTRPRVSVKYGVNGWEGNTGVSASLSLYGGIRGRNDVKYSNFQSSGLAIYPLDPLDTHSIDKVVFVSGSYPSTGSIRFFRCRDIDSAPTDTNWFDEHFRPIELLYDYNSQLDSNYFLGNYDFYSAMFLDDGSDAARRGSYFVFSGAFPDTPTGLTSSFTVEALVKTVPFGTSSLICPTIMCQQGVWNVHVNCDMLAVGTEASPFSVGSAATFLEPGVWKHVAVVFSASQSATIWIDGEYADTFVLSGGLQPYSGTVQPGGLPLVVGSYVDHTGSAVQGGWNGFLFDTRVWNRELSAEEIATNSNVTLFNSSSLDLLHYARYNDGPYGVAHGFVSGSGTFDHSPYANHGQSVAWSSANQIRWQPNDHPTFVTKRNKINMSMKDIRVIHVPSMFYGSQIDPGSVSIIDGVYDLRRIVRTFNDDGRGTLYLSGSVTRDISGEDYTGDTRKKVGNVFYTEGLIVLTDPAIFDVFDRFSDFWDPNVSVYGVFGDLLSINFRGQGRVDTKTFNCRLSTAQYNASNNQTFSYRDTQGTIETDDDRTIVKRKDGTTYVTAIGLYNEDFKLVAVAKFAQPIRKRERDKINCKLRIDI
jgi:hypothetical protein